MHCPKCECKESKVIDSRASESGDSIRRRRECLACGQRFTTYERMEEGSIQVIKKDNTREPFDQAKLLRGLMSATAKRNIKSEVLEELITSIKEELHSASIKEIDSAKLGDMVLQRLALLDKVAYVRFASVYKDFKDLDEFNSELRALM